MRSFPASLLLLCLCASAPGCGSAGKPDLLVITVDTLRADRLGCYGNTGGLTPAMDRLAAEGVRFADASSAVPITLPSHSTLFTGRYPNSTGVRNNGTFILPAGELTLAEVLLGEGWATAAVVAAYPLQARFGLDQGFDIYDDEFPTLEKSGGSFFPERNAGTVTDRAVELWNRMKENGKRRFLWVHYFDPHAPYNAPEPFAGEHPGQRYDAEVAYTDSEIDRLLREVEKGGRSPIVLLTSDHGEGLGEHGEKTHGVFLYQATLHVPLILKAPGLLPAGRTVEAPVSLADLFPTLLGLLKIEPAEGEGGKPDGADLEALIAGGAPPSRPVYGETFLPRYDYRFSELRMIRRGGLKYIDAPLPELYDLEQDPGELRNLQGGHPDQEAMAAGLAEIVEQENPARGEAAGAVLDQEGEANLRSLGYLAGGAGPNKENNRNTERGRDPKTMTRYILDMDRARGMIAEGKREEGFALLESLIPQAPENYMSIFTLAAELFGAGRPKEAKAKLEQVLEAAPEFRSAWLMLGDVHAALGEIEEADRAYRKAAESLPGSGEAFFLQGRMHQSIGEFSAAGDAYREALSREPGNQEYQDAWLNLHKKRGTLQTALTEIQALAQGSPNKPGAAICLGRALLALNRREDAAEAFRSALALDPASFPARLGMAEIALAENRLGDARDRFRKLAADRPADLDARFGLGKTLALLGKNAAAKEEFEKILSDDDRFSPIYTFQGRLLEKQGDRAGAARMYRKALELRRDDREAWERLRGLEGGNR